jgi:hypothetical protein
MSSIVGDGWHRTIGPDRRMTDFDDEAPPQGKKWLCCATCQGKGKVLVDVDAPTPKAFSVSPGTGSVDGLRRYFLLGFGN